MIFGGHVDRHFPVGTITVTDGVVNASSDRFSIRIAGRGGHVVAFFPESFADHYMEQRDELWFGVTWEF